MERSGQLLTNVDFILAFVALEADRLVYLKSAFAGSVAALVAVVLWLALRLGSASWWVDTGAGGGVAGLFVTSFDLLVPAATGFGIGCWWSLRRQHRSS